MLALLFGTDELRATDHSIHDVGAKIALGLTGESRKLFGRYFFWGSVTKLTVVGDSFSI